MPFVSGYLFGAHSSVGRALPWHGRGQEFESPWVHRMKTEFVKLVVFVPTSHSDLVRQALGEAGAGKIGNYDFCSFSSIGVGRFRGNEKSNPVIGQSEKYEMVEEERIEVVVPRAILKVVIASMKRVHPYEEVAFDVYPLENI